MLRVPARLHRHAPVGIGLLAAAVLATGVSTAAGGVPAQDGAGNQAAAVGPLVPSTVVPTPAVPLPTGVTSAAPAPQPSTATTTTKGRQVTRGSVALPPLSARQRPDVLVAGPSPLPETVVGELTQLAGSGGKAVSFRTGKVRVADKEVAAVGVDPAGFRAFAAKGTAEATGVWQAVARGEAVASHEAAARLGLELGDSVVIGRADGEPVTVRLGALATTGLPETDLVVDDEVGARLGLPVATGVLLAADKGTDPVTLAGKVRAITGGAAEVDLLTPPAANPVAFLTGSKAAEAFGAFSYRYFPDGTIQPDSAWVHDNIVTTSVPLLGVVTCHKLMIDQLRGALAEVEARGLGGSLHTYDGCYVPRFIERNPDNSISLHTWGIAIDLDASTNYRGIKGTMDPAIVEIFKRWGFRWGGDWKYTDPMHFELGALLD